MVKIRTLYILQRKSFSLISPEIDLIEFCERPSALPQKDSHMGSNHHANAYKNMIHLFIRNC